MTHGLCPRALLDRCADAGVLGRLFGALQECYRILADVECLCLDRTTVKLQLASTGAVAKFCMHSLQTSWNRTQ